MGFLTFLFWFCLFIVFYSYLGYGLLLILLVGLKRIFRSRRGKYPETDFEPEVTLVVSAFNEEDFIEKKIENCFQLIYPAEKLRLIFITDGSTDDTPRIIARYPAIQLLHEPLRRGKVAAMNRAMKQVGTAYVIFSDANTILNPACVKEIVKHYRNPRAGGVAGEKKLVVSKADHAAGAGEGLYWKYESFLKKMDAAFYTVVGAAGELFSMRSELWEHTPEDIIIEDFVQSLKICMKGYTVRYEPGAFAMETSSLSMREEQKRKVRICAGAFQAMVILKDLFNIFKYPVLSFQFISHRVLRWTISPVCLILLFVVNGLIVLENGSLFFTILLISQMLFYLMAVVGWLFANRNIRVKQLYIPYYFLFMNISVFMGFYRFRKKNQSVLWERASRQKMG
ncbi:MAG TPA: glycosyltransferase family 2 protein [Puia sp.]|nr:glycosyltransferase family 2 protein [Puia sp.]